MALLLTSVFGVTGCGSDEITQLETRVDALEEQAGSRVKNAAPEASGVSDAPSEADCDRRGEFLTLLDRLDRSDLFLVMSCGMATIAGTVLVLYAVILQGVIPDPAGHLLTASLMNAPAAIVMAKVMIPGIVSSDAEVLDIPRSSDASAMDAIARVAI